MPLQHPQQLPHQQPHQQPPIYTTQPQQLQYQVQQHPSPYDQQYVVNHQQPQPQPQHLPQNQHLPQHQPQAINQSNQQRAIPQNLLSQPVKVVPSKVVTQRRAHYGGGGGSQVGQGTSNQGQALQSNNTMSQSQLQVQQNASQQQNQQTIPKVVSKKEINFKTSASKNPNATNEDPQEESFFKQTGDFGGSQQQDQSRNRDHPQNNLQGSRQQSNQRQHYDTSPNRPPANSNFSKDNMKDNQQSSDPDGTASYQTLRGRVIKRPSPQPQAQPQPQPQTSNARAPQPTQSNIAEQIVRDQQQMVQPSQSIRPSQQHPTLSHNHQTTGPQLPIDTSPIDPSTLIKISLFNDSGGNESTSLPSLDFCLPQETVKNLFTVLDTIAQAQRSTVTVGMIEHTKDALWLLNKVLTNRSQNLASIFGTDRPQSTLLANLNIILDTYYASQAELVLACLRVLVTYLQKLDSEGNSLPIEEVKDSNLLSQGLKKCLLLDPIGAATSIHLTLKTLTQISFTCPQEIGKDVVIKVLEFCGCQDDQIAQENSIKLICNLLTNEKSCQVVLTIAYDVLTGIYQCLQSTSKSAVKFALGALLNLTLLTEELRLTSCEKILMTGGLSHLVCAIQKTYNSNDIESMHFGMKAMQNLVKYRAPVVKICTVELGYLDIIFQLCRQMYQTVLKSTAQEVGRSDKARQTKKRNDLLRLTISICLALLDSVAGKQGPARNKESLVNEAGFLPFVNRMILMSVDKPADLYLGTIAPLLSHLATLCRASWKFSKRIAEWEQEELAGNLLSLMESTDSDAILKEGLNVYVTMQESGLMVSDEISGRLKELHAQHNSGQLQLSQETKEYMKRLIYLLHNTPFDKVALTKEELQPADRQKLDEYKKAQQEASALGSSFKLGGDGGAMSNMPSVSPLKRRLKESETDESNNLQTDQAAKAYQIPTKLQPQRASSRQRGAIQLGSRSGGGQESTSSRQTQKLNRDALHQLEKQSQNQSSSAYTNARKADIQTKYGSSEQQINVNALDTSVDMQGNNTVHQQMLNRLETISLQESTRKGQSRAMSLIAGSNAKSKPRGASSVAAIGGPLPPKIPPATTNNTSGNFIPATSIGGSQSHRKQSHILQANNPLLPQADNNQGLAYNANNQSRSKSLIRGAATSRPSGIGTGTNRLAVNQSTLGNRQRDFESHIERFNQFEPLLKGQTIDYSERQMTSGEQQLLSTINRQKASSTIQHSTSKVNPIVTTVISAMNSVEDTKHRLQATGKYSPRQIDTSAFVNQNLHDIASSVRSGPGGGGEDQESNEQVPWNQLNYSRAESRGSELAVQLQSFGLSNNTIGNGPQQSQINQSQRHLHVNQHSEIESEAPPELQEEYQQPTYESYFAQQRTNIMQNQGGGQNYQPVNPFPSMDNQQNANSAALQNKHQPPLASVSEEQEDALYHNQAPQMVVPPQPLLQPKQNQRGPISHHQSQAPAQQQMHQQQPAPRTIDEMVRQNQRIIAEKSQRGQQAAPPQLQTQTASQQSTAPSFNPREFAGQEGDLVQKYQDVNLMDKDTFESRQARFQMGIGMPEARALLKRSNGGSFRQQVEWFAQTCATSGQDQAYSEVKQAVCSQQNTQKLVSLYVLAAHQMGFPMGDYFQ